MSVDKEGAEAAVVWVFGGGITGLSVAHECVERGYEVYLVEPAEDSWDGDMPAVGGLARTQWAYIPNREAKAGQIVQALPFVRHPTFEYAVDEIDGVLAALTSGESVKGGVLDDAVRALERFSRRAKEATRGAGYQKLTMVLLAPMSRALAADAERERKLEDAKVAGTPIAPIPEPSLDEKTKAATAVRSQLWGRLRDAFRWLPSAGEGLIAEEKDILWVEGLEDFRFEVRVEGRGVVPGEHGFRYFPGFYRHLFDTMRRTPILQRGAERFGPSVRTVADNLVSTEATWLVIDPPKDAEGKAAKVSRAGARDEVVGQTLVSFPRRPPQSLQQMITVLESFVRELGYSAQDVSRLTTKLFQYMTSSTERRAAEFEDLTWWDFIEGERFTDVCRRHMELGPEVLGAMTASESETRTQGNCVTQLLIDQLMGRKVTDATLNAPTSVAWFDPWRDYLVYRGVKFLRGHVTGFEAPPAGSPLHAEDVLLPVVVSEGARMNVQNFDTKLRTHYFVLAVPLTAMLDAPEFNLVDTDHSPSPFESLPSDARFAKAAATDAYGLAEKFRTALKDMKKATGQWRDAEALDAEVARDAGDIVMLCDWQSYLEETGVRTPREVGLGPLRHLTGVQYLFDNNIQFGQEHTLYMDSPWRLSSISQAHFWRRRPTGVYGYRGIVSVDIGALHRESYRTPEATKEKPAPAPERVLPKAWDCSPDQIATAVWSQVANSIAVDTQTTRSTGGDVSNTGPGAGYLGAAGSVAQSSPVQAAERSTRSYTGVGTSFSFPMPTDGAQRLTPSCYHLDESIIFARSGSTPTRISKNLSPYLINRPGEWRRRPGTLDPAAQKKGYTLQNTSWVLAGTYMKTFTRLTTMEAANESARHAVNAILHASKVPGDRCMIWNPEEMELPDLMDLKEIDRRLFVDGYPHLVEILGIDGIPEALLPRQLDLRANDHA